MEWPVCSLEPEPSSPRFRPVRPMGDWVDGEPRPVRPAAPPDLRRGRPGAVGPLAGRRAAATRDRLAQRARSEEHTSELQSRFDLVCRLLLEKKNTKTILCIIPSF